MSEIKGPAGIKEIAQALDVSIGTVDRALHGRPGVSPGTKARVLQMAEVLGYKPNSTAQALKLNRKISIAVVLPKQISHFFDPIRAGIRAAAAAATGVQVSLDFYPYPRLGSGDLQAFEEAARRQHNGIIFVPANVGKLNPLLRSLSRKGTALMCVGSDAPATGRVGSVSAHAYVSGGIAAELLALKLPQRASVAVFSGDLSTLDHAEKLRGFAATLAVQAPHLTLLPTLESHDKPQEAYQQTLALMKSKHRPQGLYLSTANGMPVLEALDELNLLGEVHVVTTDLFQQMVPLIEAGKIMATLYQRPFTQGKLAFDTLTGYLRGQTTSPMVVRLAPHVILRSNLSLFTGQLPETAHEGDGVGPAG